MQYLVAINQARALEWGLNAQQAMLFAFLHQVPTWAESRQIDGQTYFNIGKGKIVAELPLLTDKPDTAYRLMKQLATAGLIQMTSCDNRTYMRLTAKGATWNWSAGSEKYPTLGAGADEEGSEKNPTPEKSQSRGGKISEGGSEKSPTNQDTNISPPLSDAGKFEHPVFGQAAGMDDSGHPRPRAADTPRKFAMHLDWQLSHEVFAAACQRAGLPADTEYSPAQLAKFSATHADSGRRQSQSAWVAWFVDWIRNDDRRHQSARAQTTTGGPDHAQRPAAHRGNYHQPEREAVREQLVNPDDTSWADGWWPDDAGGAATEGGGAGVGEPDFQPPGGDFPEDVFECVHDRGPGEAEQTRAGHGTGPVAGPADTAGDRASDERPEEIGEYLAADDPCVDRSVGADSGGLWYAGRR